MRDFALQANHPSLKFEKAFAATRRLHTWYRIEADLREAKGMVPLGTVEFVENFAIQNGIEINACSTYPWNLQHFLGRTVSQTPFERARPDQFVKPVSVKRFTGGIKSEIEEEVDPCQNVWVCEPIKFGQEWRAYVNNHQVVGLGRYDSLYDADSPPPALLLRDMVANFHGQSIGYALDVGLVDGKWYLIEVNDGWSLGLYKGTMPPEAYLQLLEDRWTEIEKGK